MLPGPRPATYLNCVAGSANLARVARRISIERAETTGDVRARAPNVYWAAGGAVGGPYGATGDRYGWAPYSGYTGTSDGIRIHRIG